MIELIKLPTGTDRRGLHLKPPHGVLIADGVKTQIAKAKPFDLSGPWILVSGGLAYGTMEVGLPEPCGVEEFDRRFGEHRVSTAERKKWWTGKDTLYLSPITAFEPFKKAVQIKVVPGMQTVVECVEFKGDEPDLVEHCKQVQQVIEALPVEQVALEVNMEPEEKAIEEVNMESAEKVIDILELPGGHLAATVDTDDELIALIEAVVGPLETSEEVVVEVIEDPVVVPPPFLPNALDMLQSRIHKSFTAVADDLLAWGYVTEQQRIKLSSVIGTALETFIAEAEAIEGEIEGLPSLAEQLRHTQLDDTHALIMALKKYDPKNPPAKIRGMPAKAQRIWVHTFNRAIKKYPDDEGRCHKIAYGAVKNAGYYQDKDGNWHAPKAESKSVLAWLKEKFDGILGDLRGPKLGITFKGKDGRTRLLLWTTNAFQDREKEIFRTKALEEYVARHADDEVKGEFWFWHLPGAKMGTIEWQAVVGRFLVQVGPFDDTPVGRKMAEFFSEYPHDHPDIAPEGWGTSHTYVYVRADREDKIYDWFDMFEATVLPKSKATNQHSPRMEVLPMDDLQRKALAAIAGDEFVQMIIKTGEERTKELEEQGIAFKETAAEEEEVAVVVEAKPKEEEAQETEVKETQETEVQETEEVEETEVKEATGEEVDSQIKALAQQIVAGLNLGEIAQAIESVQDTVSTITGNQEEQDKRIKALEDIGGEQAAPLIPLPRAAYWQASRVGPEPDEKMADKAQPQVPDAITEMAKRIPF